jgi:hypothetical protein
LFAFVSWDNKLETTLSKGARFHFLCFVSVKREKLKNKNKQVMMREKETYKKKKRGLESIQIRHQRGL